MKVEDFRNIFMRNCYVEEKYRITAARDKKTPILTVKALEKEVAKNSTVVISRDIMKKGGQDTKIMQGG